MSLLVNVLHNPGVTYSKSMFNGFTNLFVSAVVSKEIKNIINRTNSGSYLLGYFTKESNNLKNIDIEIIIPFSEFKNSFDVSGNTVIFNCFIKSDVLLRHSIIGTFKLGVNINLGEAIYNFEDALDQVKDRATLHSVFINWDNQ